MVVASIVCMYVKVTVTPNVVFATLILEDTDRAQITIKTTFPAHTSVSSSEHTRTHTNNHLANLNRKYIQIPIIQFYSYFTTFI